MQAERSNGKSTVTGGEDAKADGLAGKGAVDHEAHAGFRTILPEIRASQNAVAPEGNDLDLPDGGSVARLAGHVDKPDHLILAGGQFERGTGADLVRLAAKDDDAFRSLGGRLREGHTIDVFAEMAMPERCPDLGDFTDRLRQGAHGEPLRRPCQAAAQHQGQLVLAALVVPLPVRTVGGIHFVKGGRLEGEDGQQR